MEDKDILGKVDNILWVYQYRIDASFDNKDKIVNYLPGFTKYYVFGHEIKPTSGQQHFQGCVWLTQKLTDKQCQIFRNIRAKNWVAKHRNSVSFTQCKYGVKNLAEYCNNKEQLGLTTNLTEKQLSKLGQYETPERKREKKKKLLINKYRQAVEDSPMQYIVTDTVFAGEAGSYEKILVLHKTRRNLALLAYDTFEHCPPMISLIHMLKPVIKKEYFIELLYDRYV